MYLYLHEVNGLRDDLIVAGKRATAGSSYQTLAQTLVVSISVATKELIESPTQLSLNGEGGRRERERERERERKFYLMHTKPIYYTYLSSQC